MRFTTRVKVPFSSQHCRAGDKGDPVEIERFEIGVEMSRVVRFVPKPHMNGKPSKVHFGSVYADTHGGAFACSVGAVHRNDDRTFKCCAYHIAGVLLKIERLLPGNRQAAVIRLWHCFCNSSEKNDCSRHLLTSTVFYRY